jgi:thioesterase domain-containing protein
MLAVVQQGDAGTTPFTFIMAGYGDIWALRDLAALLGSRQTVYALYPPQETDLGGSIQHLAALYSSELRQVQPEGPYLLGGYSAGALVGIEVARILRRDGHAVPYLALFEPAPIEKYAAFFGRALGGYFSRSVLALGRLMQRWRIRSLGVLVAFVTDKGLQRHFQALGDYQPEPYPGEMTLFRASLSRWLPYGRAGSFRRMARGGLRVYVTPGNHHTFIRHPHVAKLAARLAADLRAFLPQSAAERAP